MATFVVKGNGVSMKTTVTDTLSFVDSLVTELVLSCNYSVGVSMKTTVTDTLSFVDSLVTELVLSCNYSVPTPIIGFDAKFMGPHNGTNSRPGTLQLCSGSRCITVQLNSMSRLPQSLLNLLSAPLFCFVGVKVHEKLSTLRREYGLECSNMVDLKPLLEIALFTGCVGVKPKPPNVVMANWGAENLGMEQIESAATDTYFFSEFGKLFFR